MVRRWVLFSHKSFEGKALAHSSWDWHPHACTDANKSVKSLFKRLVEREEIGYRLFISRPDWMTASKLRQHHSHRKRKFSAGSSAINSSALHYPSLCGPDGVSERQISCNDFPIMFVQTFFPFASIIVHVISRLPLIVCNFRSLSEPPNAPTE